MRGARLALPGIIIMFDPLTDSRSFLFVPGNRPDRFHSATTSGADVVIFDLEDAVAPESKNAARRAIADHLHAAPGAIIRINAADTEWFLADIELCRHPSVVGIVLPKADAGDSLVFVAAIKSTIALIESARGILDLPAVAATSGVVRLAFGPIDLALDLGISAADIVFNPFRLQMVTASRAADIAAPIDGVTREFKMSETVWTDTCNASALGFTGKLCIHPAQVEPIHKAFKPTDAEVVRAIAVIAADAAASGSAVSLDGQMVDRPVVENARRIIARMSE